MIWQALIEAALRRIVASRKRGSAMRNDPQQLYLAAQTLFRAFCYLHPRMQGNAQAEPVNSETLAGCILHACMAALMGEIRQRGAAARMQMAI
jgi:hypothetical protein